MGPVMPEGVVSIHASALERHPRVPVQIELFQSTPRTGATRRRTDGYSQSTLPHGSDRSPSTRCQTCFQSTPARDTARVENVTQVCFNPRSRTGSDPNWLKGLSGSTGFNPRSRTGSDSRVLKHRFYRPFAPRFREPQNFFQFFRAENRKSLVKVHT